MCNVSDGRLREFIDKLEEGDIVAYYWEDECSLINSEIADCLIELNTYRREKKIERSKTVIR